MFQKIEAVPEDLDKDDIFCIGASVMRLPQIFKIPSPNPAAIM